MKILANTQFNALNCRPILLYVDQSTFFWISILFCPIGCRLCLVVLVSGLFCLVVDLCLVQSPMAQISIQFSSLGFRSVSRLVYSSVDRCLVQSTQLLISVQFSPLGCDQCLVQSTWLQISVLFSPLGCRSVFSLVHSGGGDFI